MDLFSFLQNPVLWKVLLVYWIFSAAVGAMPMPHDKSSGFYRWFFAFVHSLAGNLNRAAVALKAPGAQNGQ